MSKHAGSSLLEILICFTLISIMLLGLDVMQIKTMHAAQTSYYFSTAMFQIQNMIEQLKMTTQPDAMMINTWNGCDSHYMLCSNWKPILIHLSPKLLPASC